MNELIEAFQSMVQEFKRCQFINESTHIHLRTFPDGSGNIGSSGNLSLYRWNYGESENQLVEWGNSMEGVSVLRECYYTITLVHQPFDWR